MLPCDAGSSPLAYFPTPATVLGQTVGKNAGDVGLVSHTTLDRFKPCERCLQADVVANFTTTSFLSFRFFVLLQSELVPKQFPLQLEPQGDGLQHLSSFIMSSGLTR